MIDDSAGTNQQGKRRPYVKPFVRNLDASDTEGKSYWSYESPSTFGRAGPS
jgi:hypothetical protein